MGVNKMRYMAHWERSTIRVTGDTRQTWHNSNRIKEGRSIVRDVTKQYKSRCTNDWRVHGRMRLEDRKWRRKVVAVSCSALKHGVFIKSGVRIHLIWVFLFSEFHQSQGVLSLLPKTLFHLLKMFLGYFKVWMNFVNFI